MSNVKDLRISALIHDIDDLRKAVHEINENIRKLSANDEHTARVFMLIQEKHNGLKDVVLRTLTKVQRVEDEVMRLQADDSAPVTTQPETKPDGQ